MCPHTHVERFGRTDALGDPLLEVRCRECGRTLTDSHEQARGHTGWV